MSIQKTKIGNIIPLIKNPPSHDIAVSSSTTKEIPCISMSTSPSDTIMFQCNHYMMKDDVQVPSIERGGEGGKIDGKINNNTNNNNINIYNHHDVNNYQKSTVTFVDMNDKAVNNIDQMDIEDELTIVDPKETQEEDEEKQDENDDIVPNNDNDVMDEIDQEDVEEDVEEEDEDEENDFNHQYNNNNNYYYNNVRYNNHYERPLIYADKFVRRELIQVIEYLKSSSKGDKPTEEVQVHEIHL